MSLKKLQNLTPEQILNDPLLNKGTAFTQEERDLLGLNGFLPHHITTMEEQLARRYENFLQKTTHLSKYTFLSALQNRNEILFYRLVYTYLAEMIPLIYTPTVGDVSIHFSTLYRQHRGIYFSIPLKDRMTDIVAHIPQDDIDVIVVTDGERILGLGDVGIGGMAISQGKLALYTLFGGIHPASTLPVMLDVGTNNARLLNDPSYLGWRHPRITGVAYDDFIDAFVLAIKKRYPNVLLQWEDFGKAHAAPLLYKYQNQVCSFNDDIQGTAAVTLAAILSACRSQGTRLKDQRIAVLGGGSAGLGISKLILEAMQLEGLSYDEAVRSFYIVDIHGLLHLSLPGLEESQRLFARDVLELKSWNVNESDFISLLDVMKNAHPTVLIGVSAQRGAFTEEIVTAMAQFTERPIIFPLSNPTSKSEALPQDLIRWTQGKAIVATGSPFAPVNFNGKQYPISQCNNVSIFPGLGLGVIACRSPRIIEEMFIKAAHVLSSHSPLLQDPQSSLFPPLEQLREVSRSIAIAIVEVAQNKGFVPTTDRSAIEALIDQKMWFPDYDSR